MEKTILKFSASDPILSATLEGFYKTENSTLIGLILSDTTKEIVYIGMTTGLKKVFTRAWKDGLIIGMRITIKYLGSEKTKQENDFQKYELSFNKGKTSLVYNTDEFDKIKPDELFKA